ncbi:MAG TPA: hypothetical protein PLP19_13745 [bacterium]|nr:hypothetical protein [bacterium]HPN44550.1 hypothetical protein [bacterium]
MKIARMHRVGFYILIILSCSLSGAVAQTAAHPAMLQDSTTVDQAADSVITMQSPLSGEPPADSNRVVYPVPPDSLATTDSLATAPVMPSAPAENLIVDEPARSLVYSVIADTSLYKGTDYGCFGDVFDWLPGAYYYDRGSVGQNAFGSLYSGLEGGFHLYYDGLYLNDPFTGLAEMNMIPVESVANMQIITSGLDRRYGNAPAGQTLQVNSVDMAGLPIRSMVSYRTGHNGFDDIDARLGIKSSDRLSINMGGIIKGYSGTFNNSEYDAKKLNLKIDRRIGNKWSIRYLYLHNLAEVDIPLLQPLLMQQVSIPHETDRRSDHGLRLNRGRSLSVNIQQTFYKQELYGSYRHTGIDNLHKYQGTRVTAQWQKEFGVLALQSGVLWQIGHLNSREWGRHSRRSSGAWLNAALHKNEHYYFNTGLRAQFDKGYGLVWQPEASLEYRLAPQWTLLGWVTRERLAPSFEALYSNGPFAQGTPALKVTNYTQGGLGINSNIKGIDIYVAASLNTITDQAALYASDSTALWINQQEHSRFAVDFAVTCPLGQHFSLHGKGRYNAIMSDDPYFDITNLPTIWGKGYIQYHHIFFHHDLDARLRVGAMFMGESYAPEYYFAQYPLGVNLFGPAVVPFVQLTCVVRTMTLFIAMQNLPALEVERVYGWNLPKSQLRWGFTWNFMD